MKTLKEQQAEAWSLSPKADAIRQIENGDWYRRTQGDHYSAWLKVCEGEINGWDWRDTLQTREEWEAMSYNPYTDDTPEERREAMNKQDEKLMLEAGERVKYAYERSSTHCCGECLIVAVADGKVWFKPDNAKDVVMSLSEVQFRPIQTPADKYREEQIAKLSADIAITHNDPPSVGYRYRMRAESAYRRGVRILTPDEFVAKRLTDDSISSIAWSLSDNTNKRDMPFACEVGRAVQNAMLGEEK